MTDTEQHLWTRLRRRQAHGHKFRRQHPIGPFIVDFVCLEARLVIELDGGQHAAAQARYDARRTRWLEGKGFRVVRFWDSQVLNETEAVLQMIVAELNAPAR